MGLLLYILKHEGPNMTNPKPDDRYTLFLDILAFNNVVNAWDTNDRQAQLIELVRYISTAESTYSEITSAIGESITLTIRPAITTFSDCIVISFPTKPPTNLAAEFNAAVLAGWKVEVLKHMALLAALFVERAMPLQLLLRGGLSRGALVHKDHYIIGPALNEAYRLESTVANVPRIVVSEEIFADDPGLFPGILRRDGDGLAFLDYMPALVEEISTRSDAASWRESRLQDIESNIRTTSSKLKSSCCGRRPPASVRYKWEWFRRYFDEGTLGLNV